eukprot:gene7263-8033_t
MRSGRGRCAGSKSTVVVAKASVLRGGLYGAAAGSVQVLFLMWLRTIVNYQYRYGVSLSVAVKELLEEGGLPRFYRGLPFALLQNPLSKFGSAASYEASRAILMHTSGSVSPFWSSALGAGLSTAWRVLLMPLETAKTLLQVEGSIGQERLVRGLQKGQVSLLFEGTAAALLASLAAHYPWFLVHNYLDHHLPQPNPQEGLKASILRSVLIGIVATAASDVTSNAVRVVRTVKAALAVDLGHSLPYSQAIQHIVKEGGWAALFGRGLRTRFIANVLQGTLFVVIWRVLPLIFDRKEEEYQQLVRQGEEEEE